MGDNKKSLTYLVSLLGFVEKICMGDGSIPIGSMFFLVYRDFNNHYAGKNFLQA